MALNQPQPTAVEIADLASVKLAASGAGGATRNPNCDFVENVEDDAFHLTGLGERASRSEACGGVSGPRRHACPPSRPSPGSAGGSHPLLNGDA